MKVITELETDPRRHPQADEAAALGMDLRELLIGRRRGIMHRILFTIDDVTVHRDRHAAMDTLGEDEI